MFRRRSIKKVIGQIGLGIYTASEAARLVRVHPRALRRWLFGDRSGRPAVEARGTDADHIAFLDLVQAMAIRHLSLYRGVSLQKIRKAAAVAKNDYGVDFPFARARTLFEFDGEVVIRLEGSHPEYRAITGSQRHQGVMTPIVEPYLQALSFGDDMLASSWTPRTIGSYRIVLDPRIKFGQPFVLPGYLSVEHLAQAVLSEGSVEAVARGFETSTDAVRLAWDYYDSLMGVAA